MEEKVIGITEEEFMKGIPEIEWDKEENEIKVTGNRVKGTITVKQGEDYVVFKRKLSERKRIKYETMGSEIFVLDETLKPTTKEGGVELNKIKEVELKKSSYLQASLIKDWSKKDDITEETVETDEEIVELREIALKIIIKENKLGNFIKEQPKKK